MEYRDIQNYLEQIKGKQEFLLGRESFLGLELIALLLKEAVGEEQIYLNGLLVDPEGGCLEGDAANAAVFGRQFPVIHLRLCFLEIAGSLKIELVLLTKESAYDALAGLAERFAFAELSYSYSFVGKESTVHVSGAACGYMTAAKKKIPVRIGFMPDSPYLLLQTDDNVMNVQGEAVESEIDLCDAFALLGVEEFMSLMPDTLQELLQKVVLERFSLEYESRKQQITRFSVELAPTEKVSWKPSEGFAVTLSSVELETTGDTATQSGIGFLIVVSGEFLLEEIWIPVQIGFCMEGKAVFLKIGAETPVHLGSLASLAAFIGDIDTSVLPFPAAAFFLDELFLIYSVETGKLSCFSLELSLQDVWKLLGIFDVEKLSFGVLKDGGAVSYKLMGVFELASIEVELEADYEADGWKVSGSAGPEQVISLTELMSAVTGTGGMAALPDFWLTNLRFDSEPKSMCYGLIGTAGVTAPQNSGGQAENGSVMGITEVFGLRREQERTCFGIRLDGSFDFSVLPFVGGLLDALDEVTIGGLTFFYADKPVVDYTMEGIAEHVTAEAGLVFLAELTFLGEKKKLCVPLYTVGEKNGLLKAGGGTAGLCGSVLVNKVIGPFALSRLLFSYGKGEVGLGVCAAFAPGGLALSLDGLMATYDIENRKVTTAMEGLSLSFSAPGFLLEGGFVREDAGKESYRGSIRAQAGSYSLMLYGAYEAKPYPSAVLFGMLKGKLGGPPCFLVTGIAAGFGYSRSLVVPPIESLEDFALLEVVTGKRTSESVIAEAEQEFPAKAGTNWIAAGITANSFQMIDLAVVATALLNQGLCINLLGRADMAIPKGEKEPVAEVGLLIKLTIDPKSGVIPVDGILTKGSYVLSPNCHISGGFAFYLWYGGAHAGDFVVSLGGYRNGYAKPAHYPAPDRLKLSWKLSPELNVEGTLYFALTPSCIMAGGDFGMVFEWKCVRAWFHAYTDIQIGWRPYSYAFDLGISLGVKVDLKLFKVQMELGCDLTICGPDFSGIAHVHLWVISFTIAFGNGADKRDFIKIEEFRTSFLPEKRKQEALGEETGAFGGPDIGFAGGLIGGYRKKGKAQGENDTKVVNGQQLMLNVKSQVPVVGITFNGKEVTSALPEGEDKIYVRPCGIEAMPKLVVEAKRSDGAPVRAEWDLQIIEEEVPAALWASETYKGETKRCHTGVRVCIAKNRAYRSLLCQLGCREDEKEQRLVAPPELASPVYDQTKAYDVIQAIGGEETDKKRRAFLTGLSDFDGEIDLSEFGSAKEVFCAAPILVGTGGKYHG